MDFYSLTYHCIRSSCVSETQGAATAERVGSQVVVQCNRCDNRVEYPAQHLRLETPDLIKQSIAGNFRVKLEYDRR